MGNEGRRSTDATLERVCDQLDTLIGLLQTQLGQHARQTELLRTEILENRKVNRAISESLVDLRLELEHRRTQPERDDRLVELHDLTHRPAAGGG